MDNELIIYVLIAICILLLIYYIFKTQLKHMMINVFWGILIICIFNSIVPELKVGINPLTISIISVLGVPGIVMLYTTMIIL